ncbi:MAG: segregation/condensation protein A [Candidatus Marinimicrobia bacterium]|nr:segregation/condensation protein A [Candidatus Neomarinimicrobiota bacterium]
MYRVQLENFQGPLDLLLFFIRRDEIDIYDIPIANITREFLETLDLMHSLNISVAGEFINMAATLMQIKVRMMLPKPGIYDPDDNVDPRTKLIQLLLDYQRFKAAAGNLKTLELERIKFFPRQINAQIPDMDEKAEVYLREVTLFDLAKHFKAAMDARPVIRTYELIREPVNLDDQKALIIRAFGSSQQLFFSNLFTQLHNKLEIVVTFMALLDLMRLGQVKVFQKSTFDDLEMQLTVNLA